MAYYVQVKLWSIQSFLLRQLLMMISYNCSCQLEIQTLFKTFLVLGEKNHKKIWSIQSFCSWQFVNASKILFILVAGNPYCNQVVFGRRPRRISLKKRQKTWILLSNRVTADSIVLLMSQLLMSPSFICIFRLKSTL